jgi:hypothetical protein
VQRVHRELGQPLLVDPAPPVREHGKRLVVGDAVRGDIAPGHQRQPRVLHDRLPEQPEERRGEREQRDRNQDVGVRAREPL